MKEKIDRLKKALRIDHLNPILLRELLNLYRETNDWQGYIILAGEYDEDGHRDRARDILLECMKYGRDFEGNEYLSEASLRLGVFYLAINTDKALHYLKKSCKTSPFPRGEIHKYMAIAYRKKGMDKDAIGEYQECIRLNPEDLGTYEKLGEIFLQNGREKIALHWFITAAGLYRKREDTGNAKRMYRKILKIDRENMDASRWLKKLGESISSCK